MKNILFLKHRGDGITGPLTQRLVSALLEENISPDTATDFGSNGGGGGSNSNSNDNASTENRTLSMMQNGINIERRVKKELIEQGLLDLDDFPKDNEDEILAEIKRVRTELSAIAEYNLNELKKLQTIAKDEMKRLEIKRKLDIVDQKVFERKSLWISLELCVKFFFSFLFCRLWKNTIKYS